MAGARSPKTLARQLHLLFDGSSVSAGMDRDGRAADAARAAATVLLDAAVAITVSRDCSIAPVESARMANSESQKSKSPSQMIDGRIKELGDWRGEMLSRLRALVKEADPEVVEEWKWRGVPTWYHDGIICTGETYKSVVKMTFAQGAALKDPSNLFNSSLEGNTRRAIDFHEGEKVNEKALKTLLRAAVNLNKSKAKR
jgi:hypothetical protein